MKKSQLLKKSFTILVYLKYKYIHIEICQLIIQNNEKYIQLLFLHLSNFIQNHLKILLTFF